MKRHSPRHTLRHDPQSRSTTAELATTLSTLCCYDVCSPVERVWNWVQMPDATNPPIIKTDRPTPSPAGTTFLVFMYLLMKNRSSSTVMPAVQVSKQHKASQTHSVRKGSVCRVHVRSARGGQSNAACPGQQIHRVHQTETMPASISTPASASPKLSSNRPHLELHMLLCCGCAVLQLNPIHPRPSCNLAQPGPHPHTQTQQVPTSTPSPAKMLQAQPTATHPVQRVRPPPRQGLSWHVLPAPGRVRLTGHSLGTWGCLPSQSPSCRPLHTCTLAFVCWRNLAYDVHDRAML